MKAPLSALKRYLPSLEQSPQEISDQLTIIGLEVEKILHTSFAWKSILVGEIVEVAPHPNARHLYCISVSDGQKQYLIVNNASYLKKKDKVAFAPVGAILLDQNEKEIVVKASNIDGILSQGKICSERDLALFHNSSHIILLPEDSLTGSNILTIFQDPTFSIALTPNLGHCRSILGIARELSAHWNIPLKLQKIPLKEEDTESIQNKLKVSNQDPARCFQYCCRMIEGITIAPSPGWLQIRLKKVGLPVINNAVDTANFIMHELGQPLHLFDYKKILNKHIIIRPSKAEEILITQKEVCKIPEQSLVICDENKPIALAGIIGGTETAISSSTYTLVIESAQFLFSSIRKTSRQIGIRTESSQRFENKVDALEVRLALDQAAAHIQQICSGRIIKDVIDQSPKPYKPKFISLRIAQVNSLLGTNFSSNQIENFLMRSGCTISTKEDDCYKVKVPSWQNEKQDECDLIEEIAKLYGYELLSQEKTIPKYATSPESHAPWHKFRNHIRRKLLMQGLQELVTCSLIHPTDIFFQELGDGSLTQYHNLSVLHSKSHEQLVLRTSLLPNLVAIAKKNNNQGSLNIQAFEIGRIYFFAQENQYQEKSTLALLITGLASPMHWNDPHNEVDFYHIKGIVETLLLSLNIKKSTFELSFSKKFHPKRQAFLFLQEDVCGIIGELHPSIANILGIKNRLYLAELDLEILKKHHISILDYQPISAFPGSERDWTIPFKKSVDLQALLHAIETIQSPFLKRVRLLNIYQGPNIPQDEKRISFRFSYKSDAQTMDIRQIEKEHSKIISHLKSFC